LWSRPRTAKPLTRDLGRRFARFSQHSSLRLTDRAASPHPRQFRWGEPRRTTRIAGTSDGTCRPQSTGASRETRSARTTRSSGRTRALSRPTPDRAAPRSRSRRAHHAAGARPESSSARAAYAGNTSRRHCREVGEVEQEHGALHHALERRTACLEHGAHVLEHARRLRPRVTRNRIASRRIDRDLA